MAYKSIGIFSNENRIDTAVYPHDVFIQTDAGTDQIRNAATQLPPEALTLLVLLDGRRTVGDLEQQVPHLAPEALRDLMRSLLSAGLVRELTMVELGQVEIDFGAFLAAAEGDDAEPSEGTRASADREAASGAPRLERDGYYVSIARQAVKARTPTAGARFCALVVDDDPDLTALVKKLLEGLGLDVHTAVTRDEVTARLRRPPLPDILVLDVVLPDLNGFDILKGLKKHPALKAIPVVMLTADAKPESVVQGLSAGADGYITKPFRHEALLRGVKAVLGIA
jgi:CheY-like chemotaxis protein